MLICNYKLFSPLLHLCRYNSAIVSWWKRVYKSIYAYSRSVYVCMCERICVCEHICMYVCANVSAWVCVDIGGIIEYMYMDVCIVVAVVEKEWLSKEVGRS